MLWRMKEVHLFSEQALIFYTFNLNLFSCINALTFFSSHFFLNIFDFNPYSCSCYNSMYSIHGLDENKILVYNTKIMEYVFHTYSYFYLSIIINCY